MKKTKKLILCVTSLFLLSSCGSESGVTLEKSKDVVNPNIIQSESSNIDTNKSSSSTPPTPVIEKRTLTFKSAVVKGSGDITPVVNTTFIFRKYDFHNLLLTYIKNNHLTRPDPENAKYINCNSLCFSDSKAFTTDTRKWYKDNQENFKTEQIKASNNTEPITIKTDLSGEANITLEDGKYYISGTYTNSVSLASWESVPITISKDTKKIELSNDVANITSIYISNLPSNPSPSDLSIYNKAYTDLFKALALFGFESSTKDN